MYYQAQDIRGSTLAVSQSLKYRKTCLMEHSSSKKSNPQVFNDENFSPLFQTETKSRYNSIQLKKQSRRKTGSIGKIVRNNHSNQKNYAIEERNPLKQANNFLNQKLHYQKDNQNVGLYKKLYEQNKVLNDALKSKIYQTPQSSTFKNSLMDMSNYRPESQTLTKATNPYSFTQQKFFNQNKQRQNSTTKKLETKYQSMLAEYDKKKNFIKQQILALKQKTSLQNFSTAKNPADDISNKLSYQYNNRENRTFTNSFVEQQKREPKYQSQSASKGFASSYQEKSSPISKQNIHNQTESQIDYKFKAYQQKIQKHKEFEKRNSSVNKISQVKNGQKEKSLTEQFLLKTSLVSSKQNKITEKPIAKPSQTDSIKIFCDLIMKQIQKDEQVRVIKNNFKNFSVEEIQKILKQRYSFNIDPQRLKLSTEEYDPFFQSKQTQTSIDKLVWQFYNALEIAQNFWKNLIVGKFTVQELQKIYSSLNYSKKDKIELNEFARQISFHLNKTIRGRQIFQSYRRLSPLTRQNLISKLSRKH